MGKNEIYKIFKTFISSFIAGGGFEPPFFG